MKTESSITSIKEHRGLFRAISGNSATITRWDAQRSGRVAAIRITAAGEAGATVELVTCPTDVPALERVYTTVASLPATTDFFAAARWYDEKEAKWMVEQNAAAGHAVIPEGEGTAYDAQGLCHGSGVPVRDLGKSPGMHHTVQIGNVEHRLCDLDITTAVILGVTHPVIRSRLAGWEIIMDTAV